MIAHLLRALFRAADARVHRMVAAALDDTTAVKDATAVPAPVFDDFGYRTGRAASPADLAYHELVTELVLDAANEEWQECCGVLDPAWLLLDAPEGIDR